MKYKLRYYWYDRGEKEWIWGYENFETLKDITKFILRKRILNRQERLCNLRIEERENAESKYKCIFLLQWYGYFQCSCSDDEHLRKFAKKHIACYKEEIKEDSED